MLNNNNKNHKAYKKNQKSMAHSKEKTDIVSEKDLIANLLDKDF